LGRPEGEKNRPTQRVRPVSPKERVEIIGGGECASASTGHTQPASGGPTAGEKRAETEQQREVLCAVARVQLVNWVLWRAGGTCSHVHRARSVSGSAVTMSPLPAPPPRRGSQRPSSPPISPPAKHMAQVRVRAPARPCCPFPPQPRPVCARSAARGPGFARAQSPPFGGWGGGSGRWHLCVGIWGWGGIHA
jgi:hypothetical protein